MLYIVAGPILGAAYTAGIIVCHHACPHDIGAGFIVVRIFYHSRPFMDHGKHQRLNHPVRHLYLFCIGKVPLIQMGNDIRNPASCLVRRERLRKRGIEY